MYILTAPNTQLDLGMTLQICIQGDSNPYRPLKPLENLFDTFVNTCDSHTLIRTSKAAGSTSEEILWFARISKSKGLYGLRPYS